MKIQVKPLKGEAFDVEAEPGESIADFKAKVEQLKADLPADTQKLVFSGKVLQDGATLQECGMKDGDFLVVMQTKKTPAAVAPPPAPAAVAPTPAAAPAPAAVPQAQAQAAGMMGGNHEASIQMMCDMGFPRSDVERCLRAAFGNADRAVEYLMSGIPPHLLQQASGQPPAPQPAPASAPMPSQQAGGPMASPMGGMFPPMPVVNATGPLAKLQNHPMFPRLKGAVQQSPAMLNQVLSVINQGDPSMITLIAEHQEEFVRIMAEPMPVGMPGMPGMGRAAGMGAAPGPGASPAPQVPAPGQMPAPGVAPGGGASPAGGVMDPVQQMIALMQQQQPGAGAAPVPAAPQVPGAAPAAAAAPPPAPATQLPQLSAGEEEAVGRLQTLGFDHAMALQAYVACERNEELAANYLFDMADDN